jgi:hypothetical protein
VTDGGRFFDGPGFWGYWGVADPPGWRIGSGNTAGTSYSAGDLPRYTYVSNGHIVIEGNGGDISVPKGSGSVTPLNHRRICGLRLFPTFCFMALLRACFMFPDLFGAVMVGGPALGPTPFMHRESARDNPQAPLVHHSTDSTHTTPGVVTAGIERGGHHTRSLRVSR